MDIISSRSKTKFKVVFLGETSVGKSSICLRLTCDRFNNYSESTIGASFMTYNVNNTFLEIWDTAGQERYRSLTPMYYRGAQACIMVYDITNRDSFQKIRDWMASIYKNNEDPLVLILGNKTDSQNREVTTEEGSEYAKMIGALFYETSAKTGDNIINSIDSLIEQLTLKKKLTDAKVAEDKKNELEHRCTKIDMNSTFPLNNKLNKNCCF